MSLLLNKLFASVAWSHFIVDSMNGQRLVFFTFLAVMLGMSNQELAMFSTIYMITAAFSQPIFGLIADRVGSRWVVAGGVIWMAGFFALGLFIPGRIALLFLILASLGSGSFHSGGSMMATLIGRTLLAGRDATAASFFFLFGQMGYSFGPAVGGPILDLAGPRGLLFLPVLALFIGAAAAWQLGIYQREQKHRAKEQVVETARKKVKTGAVIALIIIAACQAWAQMNITTFLPKHLSDLGQPASIYGLAAALFSAGTAFGGVAGGYLADKLGKREVILWGLGMGSIPLALIAWSGSSIWVYPLAIASGALTGAAFSVIVVLAQRILPVGMGFASGLILGFIFSSGALGVLISGAWADLYGIPFVFVVNGGISLTGGLMALALRNKE